MAVHHPTAADSTEIETLMWEQKKPHLEPMHRFQAIEPGQDLCVSMVIPAFNEQERILPTLLAAVEYFSRNNVCHEIIVVDDGSQDQTAQIVQELIKRSPTINLIRLPRNMGKGAAVRTGILNATGNFIIINDADGATPPAEIERLLLAMSQGVDIAIGSRALQSTETHVKRKWTRALIGRTFAFLVKAWAVSAIADTQCGFKLFRGPVAHKIFEIQKLNGFAFDVEVLRIAQALGYRIVEVPINWAHIRGSKVNLFWDSLRMLRDILRVRYLVRNSSRQDFSGNPGRYSWLSWCLLRTKNYPRKERSRAVDFSDPQR